MNPEDLEGHICSKFYDDSAQNYDSASMSWHDKSKFSDRRQATTVINGTPTFVDRDGNRGWLLDNTCHAEFHCPCPWEGSIMIAAKVSFTGSGTFTHYPMLFGNLATATNNSRLMAGHVSGNRRLALQTGGSALSIIITRPDDGPMVAMWSLNQHTREMNLCQGGVVSTDTAASAVNGNAASLSASNSSSNTLGKSLIGVMNNDLADTTALTNFEVVIFEEHWFKGDPLTDDLTNAQAVINQMNLKYGIA